VRVRVHAWLSLTKLREWVLRKPATSCQWVNEDEALFFFLNTQENCVSLYKKEKGAIQKDSTSTNAHKPQLWWREKRVFWLQLNSIDELPLLPGSKQQQCLGKHHRKHNCCGVSRCTKLQEWLRSWFLYTPLLKR
jgi:hypothetical protein